MDQQVSVILKSGERHDFHVTAAELAEFDKSTARFWIGDAFNEAGLETPNPVGKVLLVDQILMFAAEQKAEAWAAPTPALRKFLAAVATALGRQGIAIDLQNYKV